jgi:hypothetical protein
MAMGNPYDQNQVLVVNSRVIMRETHISRSNIKAEAALYIIICSYIVLYNSI